jgi:hypothetical protein
VGYTNDSRGEVTGEETCEKRRENMMSKNLKVLDDSALHSITLFLWTSCMGDGQSPKEQCTTIMLQLEPQGRDSNLHAAIKSGITFW